MAPSTIEGRGTAGREAERARDELVVSRLGLVRRVASGYRDLGLPLDDLVQEGALGLLDAVDHYDAERGPDFDGYARFRVRRAIRNALTDQSRLIRLPKQIVERRRALERTEARLTAAAGGRAPTPGELAAATGLTVEAVLEARAVGLAPVSLDEPVLPDGSPLGSLLADPAANDPAREVVEREQHERLLGALARLPERERRIVGRRWGLNGASQSNAELAAALDLSPRRAQAIGRDALYELRAALDPVEVSA